MNCLLAEIIDKEEEYKSKKENLKKDYKGLFKKCSEDLNRDNLSLEEIKRIGLKAKKLFNSKKEKLLLSLSIGRRDRDKMKKIIKNRESLLKLIKLSKEKINQPIKSFKEDLKAKITIPVLGGQKSIKSTPGISKYRQNVSFNSNRDKKKMLNEYCSINIELLEEQLKSKKREII